MALEKVFYASDFVLTLQFRKTGELLGLLRKVNPSACIPRMINGFFLNDQFVTTIVFFADWALPNCQTGILTAFSGEIKKVSDGELLLLEWLTITEHPANDKCEFSDFSRVMTSDPKRDLSMCASYLKNPFPKHSEKNILLPTN